MSLTTDQDVRLAEKLEAVGELAAGLAHEINTPTQFVGDTVQFLREAFEDLRGLHRQVRQELDAAAESGALPPGLLDRVAAAEAVADIEDLGERGPAALDLAGAGGARIAAGGSALRGVAHPPPA